MDFNAFGAHHWRSCSSVCLIRIFGNRNSFVVAPVSEPFQLKKGMPLKDAIRGDKKNWMKGKSILVEIKKNLKKKKGREEDSRRDQCKSRTIGKKKKKETS